MLSYKIWGTGLPPTPSDPVALAMRLMCRCYCQFCLGHLHLTRALYDAAQVQPTDLIFFCSPNNPTGAAATREQLTVRANTGFRTCARLADARVGSLTQRSKAARCLRV